MIKIREIEEGALHLHLSQQTSTETLATRAINAAQPLANSVFSPARAVVTVPVVWSSSLNIPILLCY